MKRLKIGVMALFACILALTGCGNNTEYKVTFDSNGGSAVASANVASGSSVSKPADPTRTGYTFEGWYVNLDDTAAYDFSSKVTGNMTLKAKWSQSSSGGTTTTTTTTTKKKSTTTKKPSSTKTTKKTTTTTKNSGTTKKTTTTTKKVAVTRVQISGAPSTAMAVGKTVTLSAKITPTNATNKTVTWKSTDEKVATVDKNGKVTAKASGTTYISATVDGVTGKAVKITVAGETYTYEVVESVKGLADVQVGLKVYNGSKDVTSTAKFVRNSSNTSSSLGSYNSTYGLVIVNKNDVSKVNQVKIGDKWYDIKKK